MVTTEKSQIYEGGRFIKGGILNAEGLIRKVRNKNFITLPEPWDRNWGAFESSISFNEKHRYTFKTMFIGNCSLKEQRF